MEQPASLFPFLYSILCPRLLLVSHEALLISCGYTDDLSLKIFFIFFIHFFFLIKKMLIHAYHRTRSQKAIPYLFQLDAQVTYFQFPYFEQVSGFYSIKNKCNIFKKKLQTVNTDINSLY